MSFPTHVILFFLLLSAKIAACPYCIFHRQYVTYFLFLPRNPRDCRWQTPPHSCLTSLTALRLHWATPRPSPPPGPTPGPALQTRYTAPLGQPYSARESERTGWGRLLREGGGRGRPATLPINTRVRAERCGAVRYGAVRCGPAGGSRGAWSTAPLRGSSK